jgi:hypothetical protein
MLQPVRQSASRIALSYRASRLLWSIAVLDMVCVAWMLVAGSWLDQASRFTSVITLGGRHQLVLGLALAAFVMLAALAIATEGFTSATKLHVTLTVIAGVISVVALSGGLSAILLFVTGALLLGFVARPILRR